jgi:hypothetical protein
LALTNKGEVVPSGSNTLATSLTKFTRVRALSYDSVTLNPIESELVSELKDNAKYLFGIFTGERLGGKRSWYRSIGFQHLFPFHVGIPENSKFNFGD